MDSKTIRDIIQQLFQDVYREMAESEPPLLTDDTVLLESGLDSLGFAILVARLEEETGLDPFSQMADAYYPSTFSEFVSVYEKSVASGSH